MSPPCSRCSPHSHSQPEPASSRRSRGSARRTQLSTSSRSWGARYGYSPVEPITTSPKTRGRYPRGCPPPRKARLGAAHRAPGLGAALTSEGDAGVAPQVGLQLGIVHLLQGREGGGEGWEDAPEVKGGLRAGRGAEPLVLPGGSPAQSRQGRPEGRGEAGAERHGAGCCGQPVPATTPRGC